MMTRLQLRFAMAILLALFGWALTASSAQAQVPNIKFKGKVLEAWSLGTFGVNPNSEAVPYSVPLGQELVITDVIIANPGASSVTAIVSPVLGNTLLSVTIPAESTFAHSYASGIVFSAEEGVRLLQLGGVTGINFHLNGFLRKAK